MMPKFNQLLFKFQCRSSVNRLVNLLINMIGGFSLLLNNYSLVHCCPHQPTDDLSTERPPLSSVPNILFTDELPQAYCQLIFPHFPDTNPTFHRIQVLFRYR